MKTLSIEKTTLDSCVEDAQRERIVITRNGVPVALVVGVDWLDAEQLQLGSSDEFWKLIRARRGESTITRTELESRISDRMIQTFTAGVRPESDTRWRRGER
jgi:hypothetical protein